MEAEILQSFPDAKIQLIGGGGGIFDIHLDGALLYSKQKDSCGGFPEQGQIEQLLREKYRSGR